MSADEFLKVQRELQEAEEVIADLVGDWCKSDDGALHSKIMTANAEALRWLASRGRVVLDVDDGRVVIGRWSEGHLYER